MAQADSGVSVATGVETTGLALACVQAPARVAYLSSSRARGPQGADDGLALATKEGVSHHALQADAGGSGGRHDALGVDATAGALALGDALSIWTFLEATLAPGN